MSVNVRVWDEDNNRYEDIPYLRGTPGKTPVKGVDYWTAADKEEIVQEVLNEVPNTTSLATPDWHQNDPTAPDYIKNRSGGYDEENEVLFDGEVSFSYAFRFYAGRFSTPFELIAGHEYKIIFDGVTYIRTAMKNKYGSLYLGNGHINYDELEDTGEPFFTNGNDIFRSSGVDDIYIKITKLGKHIKFDPKYMPINGGYDAPNDVIFNKSVFTVQPSAWPLENPIEIVFGESYSVVYDGVTHQYVYCSDEDQPYIGNDCLDMETLKSSAFSPYPFYICNGASSIITDTPGVHTIKIMHGSDVLLDESNEAIPLTAGVSMAYASKIPLEFGSRYIVTVNETSYERICDTSADGSFCLGNQSLAFDVIDDTGDPFLIACAPYPDFPDVIATESNGEFAIKISKYSPVKFNPNYIPINGGYDDYELLYEGNVELNWAGDRSEGELGRPINLVEGKAYSVSLSNSAGVEHTCVAFSDLEGSVYIGNPYLIGAGDDNGKSFLIVNSGFCLSNNGGTIGIRISKTESIKFDPKYLPMEAIAQAVITALPVYNGEVAE